MDTILDLLLNYIGEISAFILGLGVVAGLVTKFKSILKELIEILQTVLLALQDGKITKAEIEDIIKEAKDLISIFKSKK